MTTISTVVKSLHALFQAIWFSGSAVNLKPVLKTFRLYLNYFAKGTILV